ERLAKRVTEQRVPIVEQEALADQEAIDRIGELATALHHPRAVGLGRDASDLDAPRRELDDEQHGVPLQARRGPRLYREEVCGRQYLPMRLQELLPGRPLLSLRSRLNSVLPQDGGDGPAADVMAQVGECPLNPRVAPVTILGRHADDQL